MSSFPQKLSLANFTLKFGDLAMLDMFAEVVYPAFFGGMVRKYGDATYMLLDQQLVMDSAGELYVAGRLVKNTKVSRDQVLRDGKLIEDRQQIESAPSCFFVLQLSNHKLFFVRETAHAPFLETFAATIQSYLTQSYSIWIRDYYEANKATNPSFTWNHAYDSYPKPRLEITPMATEGTLVAYVKKFKVINSVEVRLLETNHELDNSPLFGDMREVKEKIGADDIVFKTTKSGEGGLDKAGVAKLIAPQAESGNSQIKLKGVAINGDKFYASNENFNFSIAIKNLPKSVSAAANLVINKIKDQVALGTLRFNNDCRDKVDELKINFLEGQYESLRD
jgi:hypothetical protein